MSEPNETDLLKCGRFVDLRADFEGTFVWMTERLRDQGIDQSEAVVLAGERFDKLIEAARGPVFDDGYISPVQTCTEAEFVLWFGTNPRRQELPERVRNWIRLARAVGAKRLLLEGSLITDKDEPGDVDGAILLPDDFHEQLLAGNSQAIELLVTLFTRQPKELLFAEVEDDWWRWVEFFGRTREGTGRRKGLIEVTL